MKKVEKETKVAKVEESNDEERVENIYKLIILVFLSFCMILICIGFNDAPRKQYHVGSLESLTSTLEEEHKFDDVLITTNYKLVGGSEDGVTKNKVLQVGAKVNAPEGTEVLVKDVNINVSLKSRNSEYNGVAQDALEDSYQNGFKISGKYPYKKSFTIKGYSKEIVEGSVVGGLGDVYQRQITEQELSAYGSEIQVTYSILIKYANESDYQMETIFDEFLIPAKK